MKLAPAGSTGGGLGLPWTFSDVGNGWRSLFQHRCEGAFEVHVPALNRADGTCHPRPEALAGVLAIGCRDVAHHLGLRLLQPHLTDQHMIGIGITAPRKVAAMSFIPGEDLSLEGLHVRCVRVRLNRPFVLHYLSQTESFQPGADRLANILDFPVPVSNVGSRRRTPS